MIFPRFGGTEPPAPSVKNLGAGRQADGDCLIWW
jgi:hypothetical protein